MALTVITKSYREVGKDAYEFAPTGVIKTNSNYIPGGGIAGGSGSISGATGGTGSIAIWTPGGIQGDPLFTFDISTDILKIGDQGYGVFIKDDASSTIQRYGDLTIKSAVGKVIIDKDLRVLGDVSILGRLYAVDASFNNFTTYDTSTVNWIVENDGSVGNNFFITNNLYTYNTYIENDISVGGTVYSINNFNDYTTIEYDISVGGSVYSTNNYTINNTNNYSTIVYDISVGGTVYSNNSYVSGDIFINNTNIDTIFVTNVSLGNTLYYENGYLEASTGTTINQLNDIGDVSITSPIDKSGLWYESSTNNWKNVQTIDIATVFQKIAEKKSPASNATGVMGDFAYDASYFYICTSTNKWIRILGTGGY